MTEAYEFLDEKYHFIPKISINSQTNSADPKASRWESVFGEKYFFGKKMSEICPFSARNALIWRSI